MTIGQRIQNRKKQNYYSSNDISRLIAEAFGSNISHVYQFRIYFLFKHFYDSTTIVKSVVDKNCQKVDAQTSNSSNRTRSLFDTIKTDFYIRTFLSFNFKNRIF